MALIRSLNTAVSGMQAQQLRIEVVGNNIANVDTAGFKSSQVGFSTVLSQVQSYGMAPSSFLGGVDPTQVGLGTYAGPTNKDFTQGAVKDTGVNTDLAIEGDGFFVLRDASGKQYYTRDGSFSISPSNFLHDSTTGMVVQGYAADENFQVNAGGGLMDLEIPVGVLTIAQATTNVVLEGNLNASGAVASSGTRILSEALYDASRPNSDLISASNPLGLERATSSTLLRDLVRSLNDAVHFSDSSAGQAGTFAYVFPELQAGQAGLEITLQAEKGGRAITSDAFVVGDPPPIGGTTLGELVKFIKGSLGVCDGDMDGARTVQDSYSYVRKNIVTGEELNGTVGESDVVGLAILTDLGSDLRGARVGDFLRFTSGQASGECAEILAVSDSNGDGIDDTLTLRTDGFNSLREVPAVGDSYVIQTPSGVTLAEEEMVATVEGATVSAPATSGDVTTFTVTDPTVADIAGEKGIEVNGIVEYESGGQVVRGVVSAVSGNTATIAFEASQARAPDAGTTFTFKQPVGGGIEIAGNVGEANGFSDLQLFGGGSLVAIFASQPIAEASGESLTTSIVAYDSLGSERDVTLTFVSQSSSVNGPNVYRYFAECTDDTNRDRIVGSGTVLFDANGQFIGIGEGDGSVTIDLAVDAARAGGVVSPFKFDLDFSRLTQFTDGSQVVMRDQDGFKTGTLSDFSFSQDGTIVGIFDNGLTRNLGQVALARFANPNGLVDAANNNFQDAGNSGMPQIGVAGTFGRGTIRGSALEDSNVDLAEQFTELIIGQRAFQANARTFSASDELLQELVNLL
jgi:flagellar hook protein FlgE